MTKCLKNADGSKMTKNRQKWLKNAKNASKMLKIAQKCNFFSFSTRRFAVALQLLELSLCFLFLRQRPMLLYISA